MPHISSASGDPSDYTPDFVRVCAPNEHVSSQLSDGTYAETCKVCGLDLANSDLEDEYLWQLRLDAAEEAC